VRPDARIVNLETSVTASDDACPRKGIHYRMHPANVDCLVAAKLDCCVLANNHVLDWGRVGLLETLATLQGIRIHTAGAGRNSAEAAAPAIVDLPAGGRVLVFAFGAEDSGIPAAWAARTARPGVNLLKDLSPQSVDNIAHHVTAWKRRGDIVVVSIHWGANWGYEIASSERVFAHELIDRAHVDVVHGHSSHHVKGIEIHRDKPILYGCGDFIDDYEGIGGYGAYRGDLTLMYFPRLDAATGKLQRFALTPMHMRGFRVNRATRDQVNWLQAALNREGKKLGTRVVPQEDGSLALQWA